MRLKTSDSLPVDFDSGNCIEVGILEDKNGIYLDCYTSPVYIETVKTPPVMVWLNVANVVALRDYLNKVLEEIE